MCTSSLQYVQLAGIVTHQICLLDCFRVYCMVFSELFLMDFLVTHQICLLDCFRVYCMVFSELFLMDFLIHGVCCTILHIV